MKSDRKKRFLRLIFCMLVLSVCAYGCASGLVEIGSKPPQHFEKLGQVSGKSTGSILIGPTAYNVFPVSLNERVEKAYDNALKSMPGATGLIDVTYEEKWTWWVIGSARTVTVTGEAIKEVSDENKD